MKLYITNGTESGTENIDGVYYLISEEGEVLCSHFCSNKGFALGDLIEHREERKKEYTEKYGEYTVLFLGEDTMTSDELHKRNEKFFNGEEK